MPTAFVVTEDGLVLEGRSVAAEGTALGELVFTTGMTGYQEAVTDPSYHGQLLTFAAPMIGNYGAGETAMESDRAWTPGVVMSVPATPRGPAARPAGATGCALRAWWASRSSTPAAWCGTCATAARCAGASAPSWAPRSSSPG